MNLNYVLGGLEPHFRVLFSAIFQGLPGRIFNRVETCGTERKQKCGKLWSIYVQKFYVFWWFLCLFTGMWRIQNDYASRWRLPLRTPYGSAAVCTSPSHSQIQPGSAVLSRNTAPAFWWATPYKWASRHPHLPAGSRSDREWRTSARWAAARIGLPVP